MKKFAFILILMLANVLVLSAQTSCPTPPPGSDCTNCPTVNVTVDNAVLAECDTLKFVWFYQYPNCSGEYGAGYVTSGSKVPPGNWNAPCLQFCDDPCKCPIGFYMIDPTNGNRLDPWGAFVTWTPNTTVTYYDVASCGTCDIKVTVTVPASGSPVSFHFECQ